MASAFLFGLAFVLLRRLRPDWLQYREPAATAAALVWTTLAAFALVQLTRFCLDWRDEFVAVGLTTLAGLVLACAVAVAAAGWIIRHARPA